MCEIAVYKVSRPNTDSVYSDAGAWKRGDVVTIQDDGWPWGTEEVNSPVFEIVKLPGVPKERLSAFMAPEPGDRMTDRMLQRRAFKFDLDEYDKNKKALTEADAEKMKVRKPKLKDPNVMDGESPDVL